MVILVWEELRRIWSSGARVLVAVARNVFARVARSSGTRTGSAGEEIATIFRMGELLLVSRGSPPARMLPSEAGARAPSLGSYDHFCALFILASPCSRGSSFFPG